MSGSKDIDRLISAVSTFCTLTKLLSVPAVFLGLELLGGCVETTAAIPPVAELDQHRMVQREDANLPAVKLAVMSLTGAPEEVEGKFKAAFETETNKLQLGFVPEKADYFLRGYLTAYPSGDETAVDVVWDVFDSHKKRAQRLADQMVVPKPGETGSWTSLTPEDWEKFAALSAANLAAFVSNTPEAEKQEKPGLGRVALRLDGNSEIANSSAESPRFINEGRTIAVKNQVETAEPDAKMASFH